ncbi:MAG: hypothetical protein IAA25_03080 [Candidatus Ruminococcus intestinipullorum]|nr:hypothetical protein [Candidatus Ruminococcus intestinipullorum]
MTEKLFYQDSYTRDFQAEVIDCIKDGEYFYVVLNRTAFFPEGGGQYADTGYLNDVEVLDVQESEGVLYHKTEKPLEVGELVNGKIDWDLRFMKMQQHTGEHIVSGLITKRFGYQNVGFHLGSEDCTMDFNGDITREQLEEIEYSANRAVAQNLEIQVQYPTKEELEKISFRSKIEIEGQIRIVTIPQYDVCACCAPHVKRTGEIGLIKLTNVQRYKGGVRITMLCGFRALSDYKQKAASTRSISVMLSAPENEIVQAVSTMKENLSAWKTKAIQLQREVLKYQVEQIPKEENIVVFFEDELENEDARYLMNMVLEKGKSFCAVLRKKDCECFQYTMGSQCIDLRSFIKAMHEEFEGRGGGKPEMVQGSVNGKKDDLEKWILEKVRQNIHE